MAILPDLNEESLFAIAYYNVIDNDDVTESEWDPESLTTADEVTSYTSYDNGVEGEIVGPTDTILVGYKDEETRTFNFRVKDDGWVMVYDERMDDYLGPSRQPNYSDVALKGNYNFLGIGTYDFRGNRFPGVYSVYSSLLSAGANIDIDRSDVGVYCYKYDNATNITIGGSSLYDEEMFSYTQAVSPIYFPIQGSIQEDYGRFYEDGTLIIGGEESFQISFDVNNNGGVGYVIDLENMSSAEYISLVNDPQPNTAMYTRQADVGGAYGCIWQ